MSTSSSGGGILWAITSYFNPAGYRRRLANFRAFRARLSVPLVAVELAYGPEFELKAGDADILVQIRGRDVMWQKERLLNLALRSLPDSCANVVARSESANRPSSSATATQPPRHASTPATTGIDGSSQLGGLSESWAAYCP